MGLIFWVWLFKSFKIFGIYVLFDENHLKGFSGPFVLGKICKKIEADLTHVGLNSDHVGL